MNEIPETIDDVDAAWQADVFHKAPASLSVANISEGRGFAGQVHRVRLTWPESVDAPASVVIKLHSPDAE